MCGIVGVLSFTNSAFRISEPCLTRMRDVMSHRGPDGAGIFVSDDRRLGLGFRRLAIIDLSERAMQPMSNEDGTLWVVFNGEIYNHAEIRAELERLGGHRWKTDHSDTEVILHAFEQWGIDCVQKFRGMFAIALWDTKQRQLWLIRDRIGVKPLYYSIHHGRITFASEIKALLEDEEQQRGVNEEALYYYLSFNATPAPLTLFSGIQKLAPGTWLRVNEDGQVQECRYWDVLDHTQPLTNVSDAVSADHHELLLREDDLLDSLPLIIRHQDEPLADPVCVPVYYVSKLARDSGVIVCQVGEGSDELFWGYKYWRDSLRLQRLANLFPLPKPTRKFGLAALSFVERVPGASNRREFSCEVLRRALSNRPVFWGGTEIFTDSQKQHLLSPRLRKQFAELSSWEALRPIRQRFEEKAWEPSPLNWMSYLDLNLRLPELLLMRVDKMSMAVGLEARVPFLDHKFVELAMSIPEAVKTRNGVLKYILKKAVRGVIPDDLIDRKKQGFGVPVHEWYDTKFGQHLVKEMRDFCEKTDFFQFDGVLPHLKKRGWTLLNVALWWKQYVGSTASAPQALHGPAAPEPQPVSLRSLPLPAEKSA